MTQGTESEVVRQLRAVSPSVVAAIEAEARAALLDEIERRVEQAHGNGAADYYRNIDRGVVLAILTELRAKP